jgi:hypothetical protein
MKFTLRYLVLGLEVWLGASGILLGTYSLISNAGIATDTILPEFQQFSGFVLAVVGAVLVAHAVRRELKVHVVRQMERFGNPLDSPSQVR